MVMQPTALHQFRGEGIDAGQPGGCGAEIGGQFGGIGLGRMTGLEWFAIQPDAITQLPPEALPVIAPAQLGDQLLAGASLGRAPTAGAGGSGQQLTLPQRLACGEIRSREKTRSRTSARLTTPWRM